MNILYFDIETLPAEESSYDKLKYLFDKKLEKERLKRNKEILGFSERSVVRYMEELEKAGKVEQVGETGRNVIYRLKT